MNGLIVAFNFGLLNMGNPCVLPLYPGFLAFLAGHQNALANRRAARWLGAAALAGVLTAMLLIGLCLAVTRVALGSATGLLLVIANLIVITMGILMLVQKNPFARLPGFRSPRLQRPILSSYLYGMLYAPMTLPCSGPLVIGVFALSSEAGVILDGILQTVFFGLGFGLPLIVLPLLTEPVRKRLLGWMTRHHRLLSRIAGLLLIVIGCLNLANDWEIVRNSLR